MAFPVVAQQRSVAALDPGKAVDTAVMARRVTVNLNNVSLRTAVIAVANSAKVQLLYKTEVLDAVKKPVTLHATKMPLGEALARLLNGASLKSVPVRSDMVSIEPVGRSSALSSVQGQGTITGRVIDSATGKKIAGVTVVVVGAKLSAVTNAEGVFRINNVSIGSRTLTAKLLGYQAKTISVTVEQEGSQDVIFAMSQRSTTLSGVVTTATGIQRKVEVGNDITQINVDSVMKVMPVATLTDLLATRVPGLDVAPTSGAPGAPSRVRIRGVSSINATNDPILIVDGVRKYSAQIERSGNLVGGRKDGKLEEDQQYVPSPLDQIDPNSIETVEVLKGPSAVALYGTDAANGVILITTKRGQAGPVQWDASVIFGQTTMPGNWPTNYWNFGPVVSSTPDRWNMPPYCKGTESSESAYSDTVGSCIRDSLVTYQILNDPNTTVFGRGTVQTYRFNVRGGSSAIAYSLSGSTNDELGLIKMPDADVTLLEGAGAQVPQWQRRPQANEKQTGSASITASLGNSAVVALSTNLNRSVTTTTPLQRSIKSSASMALLNSGVITQGSGLLRYIPNFRNRLSSRALSMTTSVDVRGNPYPLVTYSATVGVDASTRSDRSVLGRGDCGNDFIVDLGNCGTGASSRNIKAGFYDTGQGMTFGTSVSLLGSTVPLVFMRWFSLRTSVGGNYNRMSVDDITRQATDIPMGATSGNSARIQTALEQSDDRSVAGAFLETVIGLANRFYLPVSLRTDAGSGLGGNVRPKFPRLAFSYLVSDEPVFRALPGIGKLHELRLRTAYGQAGVQPSVTQKLRTYSVGTDVVDGVPVTTTQVSGIGNSELRPERTAEWEGGLDVSVLGGRFSTSLTWYRKKTIDALIDLDVPVSVNGGGTRRSNLGLVLNTGLEVALNATLWERRGFGWNVAMNISRQRNRLVTLGKQGQILVPGSNGIITGFVEGYPLYGLWAPPILGFSDLNGDGILTGGRAIPLEVQVGSDPIYMGAPYPNYKLSLNHSMIVFTRFRIGAAFDYKDGMTQTNVALSNVYSRLNNDHSVSLATQAYWAALGSCSDCTGIGLMQTVSSLQFSGLSIGYTVPRFLTRAMLPERTFRLSLQGTNLGVWTNYRGKDPNVNGAMSEFTKDTGVLPRPRVWQFTVGIN